MLAGPTPSSIITARILAGPCRDLLVLWGREQASWVSPLLIKPATCPSGEACLFLRPAFPVQRLGSNFTWALPGFQINIHCLLPYKRCLAGRGAVLLCPGAGGD